MTMTIGEVAELSGVNAKLIRHYESIGLISKAARDFSGYRNYHENDIHILRFIKRARKLGFSIDDIRQLLSLWKNKNRSSQKVKLLALNHLEKLENKIGELQDMASSLRDLAQHCHGDERPECPILNNLMEES